MSFNRPELIWVIEPENKIRFRYESEGGSHGGLAGKAGKKTYPTLELKNYNGRRETFVRVSLYTEDKKEHVFEFKGKKNEGNKRYIDELVPSDSKVIFKNLHILCKKKYEIEQILMDRKLKNLKDCMNQSARECFVKRYTKDVKDRARSILNSLRLRFDVFDGDKTTPLCTLYSEVISNLKAAGKGDLRISRLSQVSGSWKGGSEIILLCEKVQKDNIKVRFYETNEHDDVIWKDYGIFSPVDVHYQVAIPFKTPPYRSNEEKKVFICLERDGELSEPREFTYKSDEPSMKKRKLDTQVSDANGVRPEAFFPELQESSGSMSSVSVCSPESSSNASSGEISSNSSFPWNASNQIDISDEIPVDMKYLEKCLDIFDNEDINFENFDLPFEKLIDNLDDSDAMGDEFYVPNKVHEMNQNYEIQNDDVDAPKNKDAVMKQETDLLFIDAGLKNFKIKCKDEKESSSENNFVKKISSRSLPGIQHKKEMCSRFLLKTDAFGNTLLHMAVILNKSIIPILRMSAAVKVNLINIQNNKNQTALHIASEINRVEAVKILLSFGSDPNLKDSNGNTCYHTAARSNFPHILQKINIFSHFCHEVNVFNDEGLTPMHLAILDGNPHLFDLLQIHLTSFNIVEKKAGKSLLHYAVDFQPSLLPKLLERVDLDVNIQDFEGNTPLHIACAKENIEVIKILLHSGADAFIKNSKQNFNMLDKENSEDEASDGQLPGDLTTNFEILKLLSAASETPVEDSLILQNLGSFQESYEKPCHITARLCKYLDEDMKWKKLAPYFLDEDVMDSLNLSSSPANALLNYVKKQEQDNYLEKLKAVLELADLSDAVNIVNEIKVVN